MMKIQEFLKEHSNDWETLLSAPPYSLKIRHSDTDGRVLFMYNQIDSDFSLDIVKEARGLILDSENDWNVVCHPMHKFFNVGEGHAADIDWDSAEVMEKKDGSIIKLYYYKGQWVAATNGTINAKNADLMNFINEYIATFEDLFYYTLGLYLERYNKIIDYDDFFSTLNPNYTYMIELCTPYNRIVVPHNDFYLYYITAKRNKDGMEVRDTHILDAIPTYSTKDFSSIENVMEYAQKLPYDQEGYVVVDKNNNRVKVKSPKYINCHKLKGENFSYKKFFELFQLNEHDEFLTYFPEYTQFVDYVAKIFENCMNYIQTKNEVISNKEFHSRKDFALYIKDWFFKDYFFKSYDNKINANEYIRSLKWEKIPKEFK